MQVGLHIAFDPPQDDLTCALFIPSGHRLPQRAQEGRHLDFRQRRLAGTEDLGVSCVDQFGGQRQFLFQLLPGRRPIMSMAISPSG